jgi:hypothetical protein
VLWLKLLDMSPEIRSFIAENEAQLKTKSDLSGGTSESRIGKSVFPVRNSPFNYQPRENT